ncbi:MAG TPA: methyltransferase domain-containing protein [Candidatus Cybelea sp.]|nr:methyltransferase domain-containing protein [Candidatus Cybelea sp.]
MDQTDRLLGGRVILRQPTEGYRVAVDAVLLAAAVDAQNGMRLLDLGCGVGSVSLCLAARLPQVEVTGLDREPTFIAFARENAALNAMSDRVTFIEGDVLNLPPTLSERFDQVALNPPYLKAGSATVSAHPLKAAATAEGDAKLADWVACARQALKPGARLTLIHRADRLADVLAALARGFGAIRLLPIHPKRDRAAKRVLIAATQGSAEPMQLLPGLVLHADGGAFTAAAEAILRDAEPLAGLA